MSESFVYILINPSFQSNYLKIGFTERSPELRAKEISATTGVPTEFIVAYSEYVIDCFKAETIIRDALSQFRLNDNREFFVLPLSQAINTITFTN